MHPTLSCDNNGCILSDPSPQQKVESAEYEYHNK